MRRTDSPQEGPTYGEAARRLEEILVKIEEGQVDIDELSGLVREAAGLVTLCRDKIHAAEFQVRAITEQLERESGGAPDSDGDGTA
jgi:exodeoxyribonuclease VII small subunit